MTYSHSVMHLCPVGLVGADELFTAIAAYHVVLFGGADNRAAIRANPAACGTRSFWRLDACTICRAGRAAPCACAGHVCPGQALGHLDSLPALSLDEVQQFQRWACNSPAVLCMMVNNQTVSFCNGLEPLVMVTVARAAGVLDAVSQGVEVGTLVAKCGGSFFYGPVQRGRAYVDLVAPLTARLPGLAACNMAIGVGGLFKCDDRFGQLVIIKVGINGAEHLL